MELRYERSAQDGLAMGLSDACLEPPTVAARLVAAGETPLGGRFKAFWAAKVLCLVAPTGGLALEDRQRLGVEWHW